MNVTKFPGDRGRKVGAIIVLVAMLAGTFAAGFLVRGGDREEVVPTHRERVVEVTQEDWTMTLQLLVHLEDDLAKAVGIIYRQQYTMHLLAGGTQEAWDHDSGN